MVGPLRKPPCAMPSLTSASETSQLARKRRSVLWKERVKKGMLALHVRGTFLERVCNRIDFGYHVLWSTGLVCSEIIVQGLKKSSS